MPYKYTGKELDTSSNLYFYESRYYHPIFGRFISPDTLVPDPLNPQGLNRYSYASNNPLRYIDPTGHYVMGGDTSQGFSPTQGVYEYDGLNLRSWNVGRYSFFNPGSYAMRSSFTPSSSFSGSWGGDGFGGEGFGLGSMVGGSDFMGKFGRTYQNAMMFSMPGPGFLGAGDSFQAATDVYNAISVGYELIGVRALASMSWSAIRSVVGEGAAYLSGILGSSRRSAGTIPNGPPEYLYHYGFSRNADSILKEGLLGKEGNPVYLTPARNLSPLQSQIDLALSPNIGLRDAVFQVDVRMLRSMGVDISQPSLVPRSYNMPGGGIEYTIKGNIPPSAIERIR